MKYVFVSSTFKDMQFERDALFRTCSSGIDVMLEPYGERVYFGDLRWGVNTIDLDGEECSRRVLEVCLDEIDDCRPYMIVLIGERYGWIPEGSLLRDTAEAKGITPPSLDISVTQLEIEYGALLSEGSRGKVFFYFRDLDTSGMTPEELRDYRDETEEQRERIEQLKARIRAVCPDQVREYTAKWNPRTHAVEELDGFLYQVERDLGNAFINELDEEERLPWQERAIRSAERYFLDAAKGNYPLNVEPVSLFDGTFAAERTLMRFIKGRSGSGKTQLLSGMYKEAAERFSRCELLPFVLGLDKYSTCEMDYFKILLYKIEELSGMSHTETTYGDPSFDKHVFDEIFSLEGIVDGMVHSFIDNCSYELQNTLSTRVLDLHIKYAYVDYLGTDECSHNHLDFAIAYSADEKPVMLAPWFDYSKTYLLDSIAEEERAPLIRMLARQKHKQLTDSVVDAIAEKDDATYPLYLKLVVDRLLMLGSSDFAEIRGMGDGMENIDLYMRSVVDSLPGDMSGMTRVLINTVADRVGRDFVMRLLAILAYGAIRMDMHSIEGVFSTRGWDFSSLDFSITTRSLAALLNYNPKDKSYMLSNPDAIYTVLDMLDEGEYNYVARDLYDHIKLIEGYAIGDAYFRAASYVGADFLADFYIAQYENKKALGQETDWLIKRHGVEYTAEVLTRVASNRPDLDFSFIISRIPTACLISDDRELYEELLQTILDNFHPSKNEITDRNHNALAAMCWCKLVLLRMQVNTSDAAPLFHSFVDAGYHGYQMTVNAFMFCRAVYYRFLAMEAFYSMKIINEVDPIDDLAALLERLGSSTEDMLVVAHLLGAYALYLARAFDDEAEDYRELANKAYALVGVELLEGKYDAFTADDVAMMIDTMLDDRDGYLRIGFKNITNALKYMNAGQTYVDSRLNKYLPRILHASRHSFDDPDEAEGTALNVYKRLVATSRALAGSALTLTDFLYATVTMEQCFDTLYDEFGADEMLNLVTHLDRFVRMTINGANGDARVLYRCYQPLRKLLFFYDNYEMNGIKGSLIRFITSLEFEDADAPILPELFIGSLVFAYAMPDNYGLRDHLRELYETIEDDIDYMPYASAYSPELMYIKLDLRTPEEIEEDNNYIGFSDGDGDYDEDFEYYDDDEDADFDGDPDFDDDDPDGDGGEGFDFDPENLNISPEDLAAMGISMDDILALFGGDEDGE